jgi:hypothetical protein
MQRYCHRCLLCCHRYHPDCCSHQAHLALLHSCLLQQALLLHHTVTLSWQGTRQAPAVCLRNSQAGRATDFSSLVETLSLGTKTARHLHNDQRCHVSPGESLSPADAGCTGLGGGRCAFVSLVPDCNDASVDSAWRPSCVPKYFRVSPGCGFCGAWS